MKKNDHYNAIQEESEYKSDYLWKLWLSDKSGWFYPDDSPYDSYYYEDGSEVGIKVCHINKEYTSIYDTLLEEDPTASLLEGPNDDYYDEFDTYDYYNDFTNNNSSYDEESKYYDYIDYLVEEKRRCSENSSNNEESFIESSDRIIELYEDQKDPFEESSDTYHCLNHINRIRKKMRKEKKNNRNYYKKTALKSAATSAAPDNTEQPTIFIINQASESEFEVMKNHQSQNNEVKSTVEDKYTFQSPTLRRAFLFLEDEDWDRADEYLETVLDKEPENAEAYLGKLMLEYNVPTREQLRDLAYPFDYSKNYNKIIRFGSEELVDEIQGYVNYIDERNEQYHLSLLYDNAIESMRNAQSEKAYKDAANQFKALSGFLDADYLSKECKKHAEICKKNDIYSRAKSQMKGTVADYETAIKTFETIKNYKDSNKQIEKCRELINKIKTAEEAEFKRKSDIYKEANEKMALNTIKGYNEAIELFAQIPLFNDTEKRIDNCNNAIAQLKEAQEIKRKNTIYDTAVGLMGEGSLESFQSAIKKFKTIIDWKDSAERVIICEERMEKIFEEQHKNDDYSSAINLMNSGEYENAAKIFARIPDWKDADALLIDCETKVKTADNENTYLQARKFMDAEIYERAISEFSKIVGYKDTDTLTLKCKNALETLRKDQIYQHADSLMLDGKFEAAIEEFSKITNYKDADEQIILCHETISALIKKEKERQKKEAAKGIFSIILTLFAFILLGFIIYFIVDFQENGRVQLFDPFKYNAAVRLYNEGKYEDALLKFSEINGYGNSNTYIIQCQKGIKYYDAIRLYNAKQYVDALAIFSNLDFMQSYSYVVDCRKAIYNIANDYQNNGNYVKAIELLSTLDTALSKEKIAEIIRDSNYLKSATVGDTILYGTYTFDSSTKNDNDYIEWTVLAKENDRILVISKRSISQQRYNKTKQNITWEKCSLRTWLNDTFYNAAFTDTRKQQIITATVSADKNPYYNTSPGKSTKDKIFILSISEVEKYNYNANKNVCWVRTPGKTQVFASFISYDGRITDTSKAGYIVNDLLFVYPCMWISTK